MVSAGGQILEAGVMNGAMVKIWGHSLQGQRKHWKRSHWGRYKNGSRVSAKSGVMVSAIALGKIQT